MEHIRQEYPVYGTTDYRHPAIELLQENGSRVSEFQYDSYEIIAGKPKLSGLPATYTESEEEAQTLRIFLQFGIFYRLKSPFEGNETVWMVTNEDRTLAIVGYYRILNGVNQPYSRVRLQGLNPDMIYENVWNHTENYGDELMNYGLITSDATAGEVPGM